jgi:hypothetical protein
MTAIKFGNFAIMNFLHLVARRGRDPDGGRDHFSDKK